MLLLCLRGRWLALARGLLILHRSFLDVLRFCVEVVKRDAAILFDQRLCG